MGLSILKQDRLALGDRVIRYGMKGKDVLELQEKLAKAGFYFGEADGCYGVLTEEAVTLFQRTFQLRVDGITGSATIKALNMIKTGRTIYTVKKGETLKSISEKYGVNRAAWFGIPGQGNPNRKIYPGMKLLLYEKALLLMGVQVRKDDLVCTGTISPGWMIRLEPEVALEKLSESNDFRTVSTGREEWGRLLGVKSIRKEFLKKVSSIKQEKPVFDLRNAPVELILHWGDFLKSLCLSLGLKQLPLVILPGIEANKGISSQLYWHNLAMICNTAKLVMIDPVFNQGTPEAYLTSNLWLKWFLKRVVKLGLGNKLLLMADVLGLDWNLDRHSISRVSFREARIISAMNPKSQCSFPECTLTRVDYLHHRERHVLLYRDLAGWETLTKTIIRYNLLGIVINNFGQLGKYGAGLIKSSFLVLPRLTV